MRDIFTLNNGIMDIYNLVMPSKHGLQFAHRANRHNSNRPGPGGKNYPKRGRAVGRENPWAHQGFVSHTVYPHSSTKQRARYARQVAFAQIGNERFTQQKHGGVSLVIYKGTAAYRTLDYGTKTGRL